MIHQKLCRYLFQSSLDQIALLKIQGKEGMSGCFKKTAKAFVLRSDLFAADTTLRYNGEPAYETLCGGVFSIMLVIFFIVVFATSFIDILNKVVINSESDIDIDPNNSLKVEDLQFGVGIEGLDFRENLRYFEIIVTHHVKKLNGDLTSNNVILKPCDRDKWKAIGDHFDQYFDAHQMNTMLCPDPADVQLEGYKGSQTHQYVEIKIEKCQNQTDKDWKCYSEEAINQFMEEHENKHDYFHVNVFMVDTVFAPSQEVYKRKKLQDQIFLSFSRTSGSRGNIKIGDYNITTDESIWPVQDEVEELGHFIDHFDTHTIDLHSTHYVKMLIAKDQTVEHINRSHGKIDDMLSYVGGLFALLFSFFVFFIGAYAEQKYELAVAQNTFSLDDSGKKYRQKDYTFFQYLKYACYDWLVALGIKVKWSQMELLHKVREEATEQMDIRLVIKKLERLQTINQILLKQRNLVCAQLTEPPTLHKIQQLRKITQYYDKVMMSKNSDKSDKSQDKALSELRLYAQQEQSEPKNQEIQIPSDFDEDDIEVEELIIKSYQQLMNDEDIDPVEAEVMKKIPKKMKNRLNKLSNPQAYKLALQKGPQKPQKQSSKKKKKKPKQ